MKGFDSIYNCKLHFWLILLIWSLCGCNKTCRVVHTPILPYSIYPSQPEVQIGDTIWITAEIPFELEDFERHEFSNFKHANFFSGLQFYEFRDSTGYLFDSMNSFSVNFDFQLGSSIGRIRNNNDLISIDYEVKDSFIFKGYCIPKRNGTFVINFGSNTYSDYHFTNTFKMDNSKCENIIATTLPQINSGQSTLHRVTNKGFKVWISPANTALERWIYDNRMYFFTVVK
jgi:hypothetical protein